MESSEQIVKMEPSIIQISEENEIERMKGYKVIPVNLVNISNTQIDEKEKKALAKKISDYVKVPKYRKRGRKTDGKPPKTSAQRQREYRARIRSKQLESKSETQQIDSSETVKKDLNFSQDKFQNKSIDTFEMIDVGDSSSFEIKPSDIAVYDEKFKKLGDDGKSIKTVDTVEHYKIVGVQVSQSKKPTKTRSPDLKKKHDTCKNPRKSKESSFEYLNSSTNSVVPSIIKEQSKLKFILPKGQPRDLSFLTNNSVTKKQENLHQTLPVDLNSAPSNLNSSSNNCLVDRNENVKLPVAEPIRSNAIDNNFSTNKKESVKSELPAIVRFFSSTTVRKNIPVIKRLETAVDRKKIVSDSFLKSKTSTENIHTKKLTKPRILKDYLPIKPKQNSISSTDLTEVKKSTLVNHKEPPRSVLATSTNYSSSPKLNDDSKLQPGFSQNCDPEPIFLFTSTPSIRSFPNEKESFAKSTMDLFEDDHVESILPDIF